jgi:hypothetical protein
VARGAAAGAQEGVNFACTFETNGKPTGCQAFLGIPNEDVSGMNTMCEKSPGVAGTECLEENVAGCCTTPTVPGEKEEVCYYNPLEANYLNGFPAACAMNGGVWSSTP